MPSILLHQTWQIGRSTPSIKHRCLQYCYTKLGRCTGRSTLQSSIHALNTDTCQTLQMYWQIYPPKLSIDAFNTDYTKLGRSDVPLTSSIHALNTTTPNLADVLADLPPIQEYMPSIPLQLTWQIYPPPIKHTCFEYC